MVTGDRHRSSTELGTTSGCGWPWPWWCWRDRVGAGQAARGRGGPQPAGLPGDRRPARQEPSPALLDQLPVTPVDLASMPDEISRELFEAVRLENPLRLHHPHRRLPDHPRRRDHRRVPRTSRQTMPSPPQPPSQPETGVICVVPPAGFEPAHTAPEGVAVYAHHQRKRRLEWAVGARMGHSAETAGQQGHRAGECRYAWRWPPGRSPSRRFHPTLWSASSRTGSAEV